MSLGHPKSISDSRSPMCRRSLRSLAPGDRLRSTNPSDLWPESHSLRHFASSRWYAQLARSRLFDNLFMSVSEQRRGSFDSPAESVAVHLIKAVVSKAATSNLIPRISYSVCHRTVEEMVGRQSHRRLHRPAAVIMQENFHEYCKQEDSDTYSVKCLPPTSWLHCIIQSGKSHVGCSRCTTFLARQLRGGSHGPRIARKEIRERVRYAPKRCQGLARGMQHSARMRHKQRSTYNKRWLVLSLVGTI